MIFQSVSRRLIFKTVSMISLACFACVLFLPCPGLAQQKVTIQAGTVVMLRTTTALTPESLNVGDVITLAVVSDVLVDGKVVIKAGAGARGEITEAKTRNLIGIPAKLGLSVRNVEAVDGTTIPVMGAKMVEGKSKMAVSIGLSLICCILFALMKGGEAVIPAGTQIQVEIAGTTVITVE